MSSLDLSDSMDKDLAGAVQTTSEQVHKSLLDNINTGAAMEALLELVAATNKFIKQKEESNAASSEGALTSHIHLALCPPFLHLKTCLKSNARLFCSTGVHL